MEWASTLRHLYAALRPGGHLAFESRNPERREWESWNREATHERIDSLNGPMECWMDVVSVADGRVHLLGHNVFIATGEVVVAESKLRFRTHAELTASLVAAGFIVEHLYGDWNHGPFIAESRLMVFVARRN